MAVLYWALADISIWLLCNDSKAVEDFENAHRIVTGIAAIVWGAESLGGRYFVILFLGVILGLVIKQKPT